MSELMIRNTNIMIAEAKRMHGEVEELRAMIKAQNAKIHSLTEKLSKLEQAQVMATVQAQVSERGHGGTA